MNGSASIPAIILAAGASTRLGRPKQTLILKGETLLARTVHIAQEAGLAPVIVVLKLEGDFGHSLKQQGCIVVLNDQAAEGMASSIRFGVRTAKLLKVDGVVLLTCDQPAITASHLQALTADPTRTTGSAYAGKIGIPAYFPATDFESLLQLTGDTGARNLLREAHAISNEALALDIDTEADLIRALSL